MDNNTSDAFVDLGWGAGLPEWPDPDDVLAGPWHGHEPLCLDILMDTLHTDVVQHHHADHVSPGTFEQQTIAAFVAAAAAPAHPPPAPRLKPSPAPPGIILPSNPGARRKHVRTTGLGRGSNQRGRKRGKYRPRDPSKKTARTPRRMRMTTELLQRVAKIASEAVAAVEHQS